jgi:hypothetical protein
MPDPPLDICNDLPGIGFVPASIEVFGGKAKLNDEVARKVLGLRLSAFLPPKPDQSGLIVPHDDPGVGTPR